MLGSMPAGWRARRGWVGGVVAGAVGGFGAAVGVLGPGGVWRLQVGARIGGESIELIRNMREGKLRPITHYRPDLSPRLVDFLHRALDVNPEVRPKTAEEWIELMRSLSEEATGAAS